MSRIERKKLKQMQKKRKIKNIIKMTTSFIFIIFLLILGVLTVDRNNRNMFLHKESKLFNCKKMDDNNYKIVFCGEVYDFDKEKIAVYISKSKNTIKKEIDFIRKFVKEKNTAE
ncbi:hypothetical protein SAMN02745883_00495 [Caminicella sporogenes DSM 14501]|uniref:Uncharacterized protein n=2 Tax=Caminicella TaxID=166484 RepID=A0A1M6MDH8_9FIRM|nr:hypothetical protein [Caminicella sporogenes]RKD27596.1 hypothetical protein BET04_00560 [Caminicella sporogenes]SHJ81469.1 hypothetical protein SAMN02745883_00495 [Caminicella sporogenes DSM 14501]